MTTIGDILDEFFSPLSKERLWIMKENGSTHVLSAITCAGLESIIPNKRLAKIEGLCFKDRRDGG